MEEETVYYLGDSIETKISFPYITSVQSVNPVTIRTLLQCVIKLTTHNSHGGCTILWYQQCEGIYFIFFNI